MRSYNETGVDPYAMQQQRLDPTELTDNERAIKNEFLSIIGLSVNKEGQLVKRVIFGEEMKPLMTYEGAVRLMDQHVQPFLSNLAAYTQLTEERVDLLTRRFGRKLALWLYSHREEFKVDRRDVDSIIHDMTMKVNLQLSRSKGSDNLLVQTFGHTSKQYVYRGDLEAQQSDYYNQQQPQGRSRWWNFGGIIGR